MRKPFRLEQSINRLHLWIEVFTGVAYEPMLRVCERIGVTTTWIYRDEVIGESMARALYRHGLLAIARDVEGDPRKTLGLVKKEVPDG